MKTRNSHLQRIVAGACLRHVPFLLLLLPLWACVLSDSGDETLRPAVVISSSVISPTNQSPIPFMFTFNREVTGFDAEEDVVLTGGTIDGLTGQKTNKISGKVYSINVTPSADVSLITIRVKDEAAIDLKGLTSVETDTFSIQYDIEPPSADGISITGIPSTAFTTEKQVVFRVDGTDITAFRYKINDNSWIDGSKNVDITVLFNAGPQNISVNGRDLA